MKRFLALVVALGFCTAFGMGCTKQAPKEETTETPAAVEEVKPAAPAPVAPVAEPAPAPAAEEQKAQ